MTLMLLTQSCGLVTVFGGVYLIAIKRGRITSKGSKSYHAKPRVFIIKICSDRARKGLTFTEILVIMRSIGGTVSLDVMLPSEKFGTGILVFFCWHETESDSAGFDQ